MPHWLWKITEGGLFKHIIQDLSIRDYLGGNLDIYFNKDKSWAYKFFLCELLNLGVVVATLFFTDWFLGGEFLTYGTSVSPASPPLLTPHANPWSCYTPHSLPQHSHASLSSLYTHASSLHQQHRTCHASSAEADVLGCYGAGRGWHRDQSFHR
ncbi:Innexin inx2 [Portunus trituberculatus]|uniref:Innexin inx2 n=1 Tax=Portunus trituberculatus TaxID=210409 RepID=A0A5B7ILI3_PORTR|nr:Innexin inx2 [Portunus trituberculatus]